MLVSDVTVLPQIFPDESDNMTDISEKAGPKANILIVDDTPVNLRLLSNILIKRGYKVQAVLDGQRALQSVQITPPDLILLDIMMPDMDGYEVCMHLKANPRTRDIPVIFISALESGDDKVKAFNVGGVDYVTKPIHVQEVLARVETHLTLRRTNAELELRLQQLALANQELQERNKELDAFSHTVAHDIKGPLGTVIGFAQLLRDYGQELPPDQRTLYFQSLMGSAQKITNIVDSLMLLSGVRKKKDIRFNPLDMSHLIEEVHKRLVYNIEEYGAEIILPESWPQAWGYGPWVEEVWANYISNGIKYGGTPPVLQLGGELLDNGMARFWVQDNGAGISAEDQAKLFTLFERLSQVDSSGHGLGLSIVQRIIYKLGGQVGVESAPGQGSKFYFTLPAESPKF